MPWLYAICYFHDSTCCCPARHASKKRHGGRHDLLVEAHLKLLMLGEPDVWRQRDDSQSAIGPSGVSGFQVQFSKVLNRGCIVHSRFSTRASVLFPWFSFIKHSMLIGRAKNHGGILTSFTTRCLIPSQRCIVIEHQTEIAVTVIHWFNNLFKKHKFTCLVLWLFQILTIVVCWSIATSLQFSSCML